MQAQVDKAKQGDIKAAAFVMGQAHKMLAAEQKRVTIIQNNYYGEDRPDIPAAAEPGSPAALGKLASRVAAGLPVKNGSDRRAHEHLRVDDDEAEKELRRRQAEAEDEL